MSDQSNDVERSRDIAYEKLSEFAQNRIAWYRDSRKINLKKLLAKDVIMFAARGVKTSDEFVDEAFRACESSSEETVIGNTWQSILTAISADTLDTGDMTTSRDSNLYVCELKSQTNTTNSSSFPQELRDLKIKCAQLKRHARTSNQDVLPAFCVLRSKESVDEWRAYKAPEIDLTNRDIDGFRYRYLTGKAFWVWLTGFDSVEGLVDDLTRINVGDVAEARAECRARLVKEMNAALKEHNLGHEMADVLALKRKIG